MTYDCIGSHRFAGPNGNRDRPCYSDDEEDCAYRAQILDVINMRDDVQQFTARELAHIIIGALVPGDVEDVHRHCSELAVQGLVRKMLIDDAWYFARRLDTPPALDRESVETWLDG